MKSLFKNKGFLLFFISVVSFLIIYGIMVLMTELDMTPINFLLIWLLIIPAVLLFLSGLYFIEFIWVNTFNQKNFNYIKSFVEWMFGEINEFSAVLMPIIVLK